MRVSGFTIVRNAIALEYPLVESILSILPIVDEYIVLVGRSEDGTLDLVRSIGSPKIRIVENEWKDSVQKSGFFFRDLTNLALQECTGDWAFYLQADEVIHEDDLPELQRLMRENLGNPVIRAIQLRYRHFYGDYRTMNPYFYRKAIRIIRNNGQLVSTADACGFALKGDPTGQNLQDGPPENFLKTRIFIHHYSWVKNPEKCRTKLNTMLKHYHGDKAPVYERFDYDLTMTIRFLGTHPKVMEGRIAEYRSPLPPHRSRWLKPSFYLYLLRHGYKG
ncbi:MAG: hypothetical protein H6Q83_202 [Deltaproteobacteria bacterium]|nr:hypothetical protein [Deltaproteobacteria bacterium]MBP2688015.1 hypothetical protein [Deltaproteobacteria bacterium]